MNIISSSLAIFFLFLTLNTFEMKKYRKKTVRGPKVSIALFFSFYFYLYIHKIFSWSRRSLRFRNGKTHTSANSTMIGCLWLLHVSVCLAFFNNGKLSIIWCYCLGIFYNAVFFFLLLLVHTHEALIFCLVVAVSMNGTRKKKNIFHSPKLFFQALIIKSERINLLSWVFRWNLYDYF